MINDEAHHTTDDALIWNETILICYEKLGERSLSANWTFPPRQPNGTPFSWTLDDYSLEQAVSLFDVLPDYRPKVFLCLKAVAIPIPIAQADSTEPPGAAKNKSPTRSPLRVGLLIGRFDKTADDQSFTIFK